VLQLASQDASIQSDSKVPVQPFVQFAWQALQFLLWVVKIVPDGQEATQDPLLLTLGSAHAKEQSAPA